MILLTCCIIFYTWHGIIKYSMVMGNYHFTDLNDIDLKVEYSFGYKLINEIMKIILHHSSLPFNK